MNFFRLTSRPEISNKDTNTEIRTQYYMERFNKKK